MYKLTCSPIFSCLRSLIVNRLTGTIPPEIGNITTLEQLVLEDNLLGGSLPPDLGNLTRLRRLGASRKAFLANKTLNVQSLPASITR
uniref:Leucine-rich repeat-containing N-terminal plant-type domain-containing protein n=1 Tax=Salix viminalis TaxID=40686 RepID=A0A6N2LH96_SALVM